MTGDCKIIGYKYNVEAKKALLLMGDDMATAEDVDGWNINLIKYELWSDGDKVPCNCVSITATTEENQVEYLKSVVRTSCVFMVAFELGKEQSDVYEMFKE